MPSLLMPFLGSLEEFATSSRCHWLEQSSVFVGRMGNIAIYLRLPCWRFTRRNLPIHSELVSGVFRVGLQEGFPNVSGKYLYLLLLLGAYHRQDVAAHYVSAKLMPVLRHSACCCHRTKRIWDVFLPSLSWVSSASFPCYNSLHYCLL